MESEWQVLYVVKMIIHVSQANVSVCSHNVKAFMM